MTSRSEVSSLTRSWTLPAGSLGDLMPIGAAPSSGRSVAYALDVLMELGLEILSPEAAFGGVLIVDGPASNGLDASGYQAIIRLWDFQVELAGSGVDASAIGGVSWVLGSPDRPPLALPAGLPERSCGLMGVYLVLALLTSGRQEQMPRPVHYDVSAADVLRTFSDQNYGNHGQIENGWRRNGRFAPEHGAIYPQGFFECRDGYVAIVARSRKDWHLVLESLGNPSWSQADAFRDPFALALDTSEIDRLLGEELRHHSRDELLEKALRVGSTIAPVYSLEEAKERNLARPGAGEEARRVPLPFRYLTRTER